MSERTHIITTRPALWDPAQPIGAGAIADYLSVVSGLPVLGVSVSGDGLVSVEVADPAQAEAVVAALDILDPAGETALPPDLRQARRFFATVKAGFDAMDATPEANRTNAQRFDHARTGLLLMLARLAWQQVEDGG